MNNAVIRPLAPYRLLISRTVVGLMLLFLLVRMLSGAMPQQWLQPPVMAKNYDLSQWLFRISGLDALLVQSRTGAGVFSALLLVFGLLSFLFPLMRRFTLPFAGLFFLYALSFNMYLLHNSHYLAGAVWLSLCLLPRQDSHFEVLWEGFRYYVCFAYGAAFLWKLWGGSFSQADNGFLVSKGTLVEHLFYHADSPLGRLQRWSLAHPAIPDFGQKLIAIAEGSFLIGFFTRRADGLLLLLIFFIHLSTLLFADVFFVELALAFALPFLPLACWQNVNERLTPRSERHLL